MGIHATFKQKDDELTQLYQQVAKDANEEYRVNEHNIIVDGNRLTISNKEEII